MTDTEKTQKILEVFNSLPEDLQKALTSSDLSSKIRTVGNRHSLHLDKMNVLELEIMLVLLGIEPVSQFVNGISKQLQISKAEAEVIASDVHDSILHSVTNSLKGVEREMSEEDDGPSTQSLSIDTSSQSNSLTNHDFGDIGILESHAEILHAIENPEEYRIPPIITPKSNIRISPELQNMVQSNSSQNLKTQSSTPTESIQSILGQNTDNTSPNKPHDPYREPLM